MIQRFHVVRRLSKKETWPITAIKDCTVCLRRELLKSWEIWVASRIRSEFTVFYLNKCSPADSSSINVLCRMIFPRERQRLLEKWHYSMPFHPANGKHSKSEFGWFKIILTPEGKNPFQKPVNQLILSVSRVNRFRKRIYFSLISIIRNLPWWWSGRGVFPLLYNNNRK